LASTAAPTQHGADQQHLARETQALVGQQRLHGPGAAHLLGVEAQAVAQQTTPLLQRRRHPRSHQQQERRQHQKVRQIARARQLSVLTRLFDLAL
jgi:hypothetical protein